MLNSQHWLKVTEGRPVRPNQPIGCLCITQYCIVGGEGSPTVIKCHRHTCHQHACAAPPLPVHCTQRLCWYAVDGGEGEANTSGADLY